MATLHILISESDVPNHRMRYAVLRGGGGEGGSGGGWIGDNFLSATCDKVLKCVRT
jgi:hypothetical protein